MSKKSSNFAGKIDKMPLTIEDIQHEAGHDISKSAASHDQKQNILDIMSDIMSDKMSNKEIERMRVIISYLLEHVIITTSKAAELLKVGDKTAQRLLSKGEIIGVLDSKGENKGKQYNLKDLA